MGGHVTARIRIGAEPTRLERLAVVFADPIRLKIVTELFRCEMSASQFYAAYGGGSLSRVDRHFKRLAEHGWLRLVRQETGGRRRGSTEHFYRAPELAIFDTETWALLPQSVKLENSWRIFEQFAERVKLAFEAETFDARDDRHFTWTPLTLDELGRSRVIGLVDSLFATLFEEQTDASVRLSASGEDPVHLTVGLAAFDSPTHRRDRSGLYLRHSTVAPSSGPADFMARIAKVFCNPMNLRIVTELNLRSMSVSQFAEEIGGTLPDIYRRFTMLTEIGWLRIVETKTGGRRRGATERFYEAAAPMFIDTRNWSRVPDEIRRTFSWRIFEQLAEQVRQAMDAETFDSRDDRHLSWTPLVLDQRGWDQVIAAIDSLFHSLAAEQRSAARRLEESGVPPDFATVYLAAFESPAPPYEGSDPAEYF